MGKAHKGLCVQHSVVNGECKRVMTRVTQRVDGVYAGASCT